MKLVSAQSNRPEYSPNSGLQRHLISDLPTAADIRPYLERIDANRWYTNFGPLVCEFEQKITALLSAADPSPNHGTIHSTTMTSCHLALEIALRLVGVSPGGKTLIPAVTFPGCALAVQHAGGEVIFGDVDPSQWVLTPETARLVAQKIKLAAVMPTALYGIPLSAIAWDEFSRDTGIPVIIDAAAVVEKQEILQNGLVAHSLHATKPFGVGEGGLLVSRNQDIIARARRSSNFGMIDRVTQIDGTNAKMSEYHAAVGLAQILRWPMIKQKRHEILGFYKKHLKPFANIVSLHPAIDKAVVSLLMLKFKQPVIDKIAYTEGVPLHRTYLPPLYHHPFFAGVPVADKDGNLLPGDNSLKKKTTHMTNSEMMHNHIIGVPFHPFLSEDDIAFVTLTIQRLARNGGD
jgi:dTDP-4-amino-4,6-dideoxygalactose transaminase